MFFLAFLLIFWYPASSLCGTCKFYDHTFYCSNINQDEFLYQLFKQRAFLDNSYVDTVVIEDSNYSTVEPFPIFESLLPNITIKILVIRRSSIADIDDDAFSALNHLDSIDLSWNQIKDFAFFNGVPRSVKNVDLSNNNIVKLNLNYLKDLSTWSSIRLNNNNIAEVQSADAKIQFNFLDLSYNQLSTFLESSTFHSESLNISYNNLLNVNVLTKDILTVYGNSAHSFSNSDVLSANTIYTSSIPTNTLYVKNLFSMANKPVKALNLETPLKLINTYGFPLIVDMSNTSLIDISSDYFKDVTEWEVLNLSYNNLTNLDKSLFSNARIKNINLSFSGIKTITKTCFRDSSSYLQSINLSGNFIENTDICESLLSLRSLDLSRNIFTVVRTSMLAGCNGLQNLTISKCLIHNIEPETFAKIPIEVLDLSENLISSINATTFSNLSHVITINLRKNKINTIGSYSFHGLKSLTQIDLSENLLQYIDEHAFSHLVSIVYINLSNCKFNTLSNDFFTGVVTDSRVTFKTKAFDTLSSLQVLNMSNIGAMLLESEVIYNSQSFVTIDLVNNDVLSLASYAFKDLPVVNIYLAGNTIEEINTDTFHNLTNLQELNLSNLGISKLHPYAFRNIPNLKLIDLRDNDISGVEKNVFSNVKVQNIFLNRITEPIYLDNTNTVENFTVQFIGVMKEKTVSNIYLKRLLIVDSQIDVIKNNCFLGSYNLENLIFVNSSISLIEPNCLAGLFSLLSLDASFSFQNTIILKNENVFQDLSSLRTLNLSNNNLAEIEENAFSGLVNLQELYLGGNKLSSINDATFNYLNLTVIDLSSNQFTSINLSSLIGSLPFLKSVSICCGILKTVYASNDTQTNRWEYLDLSNNELTYLEESILGSLITLNTLYLNNNKLYQVDGLNYTKDLKELRLDSNNLAAVYQQFKELEGLKFLNISNNPTYFLNFPSYAVNPLSDVKNINTLYVDYTSLIQFPYTTYFIFPHLKRVGINGNKYSCKFVEELIRHFIQYKVDYTPYNPRYDVSNVEGITCSK